MRLLHTSDLHLGLSLYEESMIKDQTHILNEIIQVIKNNDVDGIMISGDIYDQRQPSPEAITLFDNFLVELSNLDIDVYIIPGNHDRRQLIGYGSKIFEHNRIHICAEYNGKIKVVEKDDVNVYLMPFIRPSYVQDLMSEDEYSKIKNTNDLFKWILSKEKLDKNKRNIILLHQYIGVTGKEGKFSESESSSYKGKTDLVDYKQFLDFDYVALGHLHAPQIVKENKIRYCGTPCKYSFSEVDNENGVVIYDSESGKIETIKLNPLRGVRIVSGTIDEILKESHSEDLIKLDIKDEDIATLPWPEIYSIFPKTLTYTIPLKKRNKESIFVNNNLLENDLSVEEVFENLFEYQNGRGFNDIERKDIQKIINMMEEE